MDNVVASGIADKPHLTAFDDAAKDSLDSIDLTPLFIYMVDSVQDSALPYLAAQFDLLGYKGWRFADTIQKQRDLIKRAIELHRYKGTPWSIKEALKAVDVNDASFQEGVPYYTFNGVINFDGTQNYGGGFWAKFRCYINIEDMGAIDSALLEDIKELINEYKPARCQLVDITLLLKLSEQIGLNEDFLSSDGYIEYLTQGILYDGTGGYNGSYSYNKANDVLVVNVIS